MRELSRREVLGGLTTSGVTGLAGCVDGIAQADGGSEPTGGDESGPSDDNESTPGRADEFTVDHVSVDTVDSNCLQPNKEPITVAVTDEVVSLAGVKTASNPCQEVGIDTAVAGTELLVDVTAEPDDHDDTCVQCTGSLEYESTISLSTDAVETVAVSHGTNGPKTTVDADDAPDEISGVSHTATPTETRDSNPEPAVEHVETLETGCATGENSIGATRDGDIVSVEGVIDAPDPCHTAVVSDISLDNSELEVAVGVEPRNNLCQQCLGEVTYEATIDLDGADVERVVVDHGENSHTADLG